MLKLEKIHCLGEVFPGEKKGESLPYMINEYYWSDVLEGLPRLLKKYEGKIQLIYMDPPFVTGQLFEFRQRIGERGWGGDQSYILSHTAYDDSWKEGKQAFLDMMKQVMAFAHRLLAPEGSVYLHIDYRTSAYMRILMDEIFGEDNFLNEIIWHYQSGGRAKRHFSRKHDTILFYRKGPKYYFNMEQIGKPRGKAKKNHMKQQVDEDGRVFWSIKSGNKVYKYYEDDVSYPSDVWDDIPHLHQKDPERTGYDTQKPEALLERMIRVSSREGDLVADFFAGSGTTLAVAQRLGRKWIGIDKSIYSLHICRKRLSALGEGSDTVFLFDEDRPYESTNMDIRVTAEKSNDGEITVSLVDCLIPDSKKEMLFSKQVGWTDYIDYWAVGYIEQSFFTALKYSFRDTRNPTLQTELRFREKKDRQYAIHVVDIFGCQDYYILK